MNNNEKTKLSFEFARDTTKLLITLAVSIITLTITFSKDFIGEDLSDGIKLFVLFAWGAFFFSIVCGCWTLMALTGSLTNAKHKKPVVDGSEDEIMALTGSLTDAEHGDIFRANIVIPSVIQIISFLVGLVLTMAFGVMAL